MTNSSRSEKLNKKTEPDANRTFQCVLSAFNKVLYDYSYVFSAIAVFVLFAVLFSKNNIYPFGKLSVSWCDGDQQFIPLLCDFKDILDGKSGFFFSNGNAGGMNFYGVYFFNLSSPFTYFIAFYQKNQMAQAFNVIVMLKLITSAATMSLLLKRKTKNFALVIFPSVLYAFSGYTMMYYQIAQWLDVYYMFPLLLIGLERMTEGKSNIMYTVCLVLCVLFHFYLSYPVIIFISLYAAVYTVYNYKTAQKFALSFIIGSAIAACISAVILLPCFLQYTDSMRTSSITETLRSSNFFPSVYTTFPTYFCLACLLVFAFYYCAKNYRDFKVALFLLSLVPVIIEPVAKAWQTFNYMSFPTRYGFVPITLCLYFAVSGIERLSKDFMVKSEPAADISDKRAKNSVGANVRTTQKGEFFIKFIKGQNIFGKIFYSVVVAVCAILVCRFSVKYYNENGETLSMFAQTLWGKDISYKGLLVFALFSFLTGAVLFVALRFKVAFKSAVFGAIGLCLIFESVFSCNVYMISAVTFRSEFYNMSNKIERISELDGLIKDDDFYRVKVDKKLFEVNMVGAMGYNSLSHYTSLNSRNYMMTAKALGYSSYWMEVNSCGGTIFSDALVRNKYTVYSGKKGDLYKTDNYSVSRNDLLFPAAFVTDVGDYTFDTSLERMAIQEEFFTKLTGKSGLFEKHSPETLTNLDDTSANGKIGFTLTNQKQSGVLEYSINVVGTRRIYLDLFDRYSNSLSEPTYSSVESVAVYKSGTYVRSYADYPAQNSNGILDLGEFSNCRVKINVKLKKNINATSFGVFSIDKKLLESAVNQLIGGDFKQIGNGFSCKITSDNGGYLFVSVPYDKGFKATVNGKKTTVNNFGGFMAVKLDKGENVVSFNFVPRGFTAGLVITIFGMLVFVLYAVFRKRLAVLSENSKKFAKVSAKTAQICVYLTLALGVFIIAVIYLFPVFVNLFM